MLYRLSELVRNLGPELDRIERTVIRYERRYGFVGGGTAIIGVNASVVTSGYINKLIHDDNIVNFLGYLILASVSVSIGVRVGRLIGREIALRRLKRQLPDKAENIDAWDKLNQIKQARYL